MPTFAKGESGEHEPTLSEKWTQPPKYHTEATLLRAMETAGKSVDNDELRDALKENGIGRPSTRAAVIETLFKRNYIRKERKNLIATSTGVQLIGCIREELLKSAELTGMWEKKLRQIERREYEPKVFLDELKEMLTQIVTSVRNDWGKRIEITAIPIEKEKIKEKSPQKKTGEKKPRQSKKKPISPLLCPVCKKGKIIKGKTAYGCSEWQSGCTFRLSFDSTNQNLTDNELGEILGNT